MFKFIKVANKLNKKDSKRKVINSKKIYFYNPLKLASKFNENLGNAYIYVARAL